MPSHGYTITERNWETPEEKEEKLRKKVAKTISQHVYDSVFTKGSKFFPDVPEEAEIRIRPISQERDEILQAQSLFAHTLWSTIPSRFREKNRQNIKSIMIGLVSITAGCCICLHFLFVQGEAAETYPEIVPSTGTLIVFGMVIAQGLFFAWWAMWNWPIRGAGQEIEFGLRLDFANPFEYYTLSQTKARCVVAVTDIEGHKDLVVGVAAVEPAFRVTKGSEGHCDNSQYWRAKTDVQLRRLAVSPFCRHRGVGRRLVEDLVTFSKAKGYDRMVVTTPDTQTEALAMFHKVGFKEQIRHNGMGIMGDHSSLRLVFENVYMSKELRPEKKGR